MATGLFTFEKIGPVEQDEESTENDTINGIGNIYRINFEVHILWIAVILWYFCR